MLFGQNNLLCRAPIRFNLFLQSQVNLITWYLPMNVNYYLYLKNKKYIYYTL